MRVFFAIFFLFIFLLSSYTISNADTTSCLVCHGVMKGNIKANSGELISVYVDPDRYSQSVHGGVDCISCHKQFSTNPHEPKIFANIPKEIADLSSKLSHKAKVDPTALASCVECHVDVFNSWQNSIHGENIINKKSIDGATCIDCHGSPHYIVSKNNPESLANKKNTVRVCGECHKREDIMKKYGYGPHIVERYIESFHGKKYILGHPNAPSCTDCHEYHDVKKWDDPNSPVYGDNKLSTCGKCHKGATKKFVASITHKPVGKNNPIPYYFGKGLTILMLSVFTFITGHVVLEVFSEIRDRILRKKREEDHE